MPFQNLDFECASLAERTASKLFSNDEGLVLTAAGILPKQGPYALALFIDERADIRRKGAEGDAARTLKRELPAVFSLLAPTAEPRATTPVGPPAPQPRVQPANAQQPDLRAVAKQISGDIATLLLARRVLAQYFAYLKYLVRMRPKKEQGPGTASHGG